MTLLQIQMFLAVEQHGNFTKAANAMHISPPGLTKQIISMEKELGYKLFHRTTRQVTLTESGLIMKNCFEKFLKDFTLSQGKCLEKLHEAETAMTVYMPSLFKCRAVRTLLEEYQDYRPEIAMTAMCYTSLDVFRTLNFENIDLIFGSEAILGLNDDIDFIPVCLLEYEIIYSAKLAEPGRQVGLADLAGLPLLIFQTENEGFKGNIPGFKEKDLLEIKEMIELPNSESLFYNVGNNRGYAIVDEGADIPEQYKIQRMKLSVYHKLCVGWMKGCGKKSVLDFINYVKNKSGCPAGRPD